MAEFMDWATKFMNSKEINRSFRMSSLLYSDKGKKYGKGSGSKKLPFFSSSSLRTLDPQPSLQDTRTNIFLMLEKHNRVPKWPTPLQHKSMRGFYRCCNYHKDHRPWYRGVFDDFISSINMFWIFYSLNNFKHTYKYFSESDIFHVK